MNIAKVKKTFFDRKNHKNAKNAVFFWQHYSKHMSYTEFKDKLHIQYKDFLGNIVLIHERATFVQKR